MSIEQMNRRPLLPTSYRLSCLLLLLVGVAVLWGAWTGGSTLIAASRWPVGAPPEGGEPVSFKSESGAQIKGWLLKGEDGKGAVVLLHGIRANRSVMVPRALFLNRRGYTVLLVDLQGHGESGGNEITFGFREAKDAEASIKFLEGSFTRDRIGAIGVSLGGAALLLSQQPLRLGALVVESVYPTIEEAAEDRLKGQFGTLATYIKYVLLWQLQLRLGITPSQLAPINHIAEVGGPVLVTSGTIDPHPTIGESERICAAAAEPKECWWVNGAAHVDLYAFSKEDYEKRIADFLHRYLDKTEVALAH